MLPIPGVGDAEGLNGTSRGGADSGLGKTSGNTGDSGLGGISRDTGELGLDGTSGVWKNRYFPSSNTSNSSCKYLPETMSITSTAARLWAGLSS